MQREVLRLLSRGLAVFVVLPALAVTTQAGDAAVARFTVGAAVGDYTPPAFNSLASDPTNIANCPPLPNMTGARQWAFEEPYQDRQGTGHWDLGDPFQDCDPTNGTGRWEGNFLGGGSNAPRYYDHVADPVGARAIVVGNGTKTIAVEVLDHEGFFGNYMDQVRAKVAADGVHLDGIYISSTHDESAPDSIGLYGVQDPTGTVPAASSVNHYWVDYVIQKSAEAIENAYRGMRPATIQYAEAIEPANLRQCFSSYPYVDDQLMPSLRAIDASGHTIAVLGDVSQHTETLGFNGGSQKDGGYTLDQEKDWVSADWPYWFRSQLEAHYAVAGAPAPVAIEMAGSVGSNETPEVFSGPISRTPQQFVDEGHPAGCRTLFNANGTMVPLGYYGETRALGQGLAGAVASALDSDGHPSASNVVDGVSSFACIRLTNQLFAAAGLLGVFGDRPGYDPTCTVAIPPAPQGTTAGTHVKAPVAAFRIGDGEFASVPGEVFPFTYLRGFQGPGDMPLTNSGPPLNTPYGLSPWLMPHMHTPYRFIDGLGEDMIGYIFPQGNGVGVPGEYPLTNPTANSEDRFGCGHSDDSEAASSQSGDLVGEALVGALDQVGGGAPERVETGRYVLPSGALSRDPLGGPEIKCNVDKVFQATGPAAAVWLAGGEVVQPARWMSLSGRPQAVPDRNTRGYLDAKGARHWLEVFPDIAGAPASVSLAGPAGARAEPGSTGAASALRVPAAGGTSVAGRAGAAVPTAAAAARLPVTLNPRLLAALFGVLLLAALAGWRMRATS